jgi:hypothetical protein
LIGSLKRPDLRDGFRASKPCEKLRAACLRSEGFEGNAGRLFTGINCRTGSF